MGRIKRSELEKYLGKKVEITLFDDEIYKGILHKTGEEMFKNNYNLYLPKKLYFLIDEHGVCKKILFRCSHVKKLREEG